MSGKYNSIEKSNFPTISIFIFAHFLWQTSSSAFVWYFFGVCFSFETEIQLV